MEKVTKSHYSVNIEDRVMAPVHIKFPSGHLHMYMYEVSLGNMLAL